jgi:broad specificity phosphatase PhoE
MIKKKRFVNITYFVHGTTVDNEKGLASGCADAELSKIGKRQSIKLEGLIKNRKFDVVFCSDLRRAVDSARLAFGTKVRIKKDKRLRECNYGELTREKSKLVDSLILEHIEKPFPNGESYTDVEMRIKSFLKDLLTNYSGMSVAIVAHRAPQLALDVLLKGKTWQQAVKEDWRFKRPKEWKPGWEYKLKEEAKSKLS